MLVSLLSMLLSGVSPVAEAVTARAMNTHDTAMFERQLREMGYTIDPFTRADTTASSIIHKGDDKLAIVLGGCTKGDACTYVVLASAFTDVARPPADWVARMAADYDLIKVFVRDDGKLAYSAATMMDGAPRALFKSWVDQIELSGNDLAREALKAKLIK